jgi:hypothetical protein
VVIRIEGGWELVLDDIPCHLLASSTLNRRILSQFLVYRRLVDTTYAWLPYLLVGRAILLNV